MIASTILVAATQVRPSDPVPQDAAFWRTITHPTPAEPDVWAPIETLSGGVQGTALGLGDFGEVAFNGILSVVGALRASISTPPRPSGRSASSRTIRPRVPGRDRAGAWRCPTRSP